LSGELISIDGSYGEGGGQIVRTSLSLAALLGRGVEITKIRAGRRKPGLMAQHLTGVMALLRITRGSAEGASLGSERLVFRPGRASPGNYTFDVSEVRASAGSVGMIYQSLLPVLIFAGGSSHLTLKGGTHTNWAPSVDYLKEVFLPMVGRMGVRSSISVQRWGWYPEGKGVVEAEVEGCRMLTPIDVTCPGDLRLIRGISAVSNLPLSIAARQRDQAYRKLRGRGWPVEIELFEAPSVGRGTFILLVAEFENSVAGFSALGERGKPAESVADEAADRLIEHISSGAGVDPHLSDQMVLYMALAHGRSAFTTSRLSQHLTTNIWAIERFLPVRFEIDAERGMVSTEGIGLTGEDRPENMEGKDG